MSTVVCPDHFSSRCVNAETHIHIVVIVFVGVFLRNLCYEMLRGKNSLIGRFLGGSTPFYFVK